MIASIILAGFLIGASDRYQVIGESEKYKILVELSTVAQVGELREARMVYRLKDPSDKLIPNKKVKITYVIKNSEYDCKNNRLRILNQAFFDKNLSPHAITDDPLPWVKIEDKTNASVEQKFVCSYKIPLIPLKNQTLVQG